MSTVLPKQSTSTLERGELSRLVEATGKSVTHLHFVLRGKRQPARGLALRLEELGHPVWALYPDLNREPITVPAEEAPDAV